MPRLSSAKKGAKAAVVIAIGGFDPSCGAGVVADARTLSAMGAVPTAVVTAITVQSGVGVRGFSPVPVARVLAQLEELLTNLPVAAVKIGQVPSAAVARALGRCLANVDCPVVLDPVLVASGGGSLVGPATLEAITRFLLPRASLVTVNLAEAAAFTGQRVLGERGMHRAAQRIEALGARAVLVKGGHLSGAPVDVLRHPGGELVLRGRRLPGSMHGTGCALASAAAARLAAGDPLVQAVRAARTHVRELLSGAVLVGRARLRAPSSS